jgi:hypothetical protein
MGNIYQQRWSRIQQAVALEKPDRIPVVLEYSGFAAYVTQTPMSEFLASPAKNLETMIKAYHMIGEGDAINYGSFWPYGLCYDFMSKVRVPGVDLPDNEMWQVVETELMKPEDYDRILDLDGDTDIFKAKKALGNHLCLMGDVSASMLYLEEPEDVYAYSAKLIRELGPEGFILQSGCDIPTNAKLENVQAMVAAATG